ncbi:MAG: hypothetical protein ACP5JU_03455 [Minisyncoccia bacterium]
MFKNKDKELFNALTIVHFASTDFQEISDALKRSEINIERIWYKIIDTAEYKVYYKNEKVAEVALVGGYFESKIYKTDGWIDNIYSISEESKELYKRLYKEEKANGTLTKEKKEEIKILLRL